MDAQGLAVLGYRVMETVGRDITDINFSRGFAIELGSTLSVVLASVVGEPRLMRQISLPSGSVQAVHDAKGRPASLCTRGF